MQPKVSIILLNYNGKQYNKNCIDSLLLQTYQSFEIVFVNNASDDWSCEQVEKLFATEISQNKIRIIQPWYNSGFATGNNIGAQNSNATSYICLLNNDTVLPIDWLEYMIQWIESDPNLGVVGGMVYDDGYENVMKDLFFKQHKKWVNNYFFDSVIIDQTPQDMSGDIVYTTGVSWCCLLYKKELLDKPFDDIYFAYMEDTALCMKILLQWYRVGLAKKAVVHHLGSWSFWKKPTVFKVFHGQKNYILNFILFSQWYRWIVVLPFFIVWVCIRTFANYPLIRIKWLMKAIFWVSTHYKTIIQIKICIRRNIHPKQFYSNLSPLFLSLPFYVHVHRLHAGIIHALNKISQGYFRLFRWLFTWQEK